MHRNGGGNVVVAAIQRDTAFRDSVFSCGRPPLRRSGERSAVQLLLMLHTLPPVIRKVKGLCEYLSDNLHI